MGSIRDGIKKRDPNRRNGLRERSQENPWESQGNLAGARDPSVPPRGRTAPAGQNSRPHKQLVPRQMGSNLSTDACDALLCGSDGGANISDGFGPPARPWSRAGTGSEPAELADVCVPALCFTASVEGSAHHRHAFRSSAVPKLTPTKRKPVDNREQPVSQRPSMPALRSKSAAGENHEPIGFLLDQPQPYGPVVR